MKSTELRIGNIVQFNEIYVKVLGVKNEKVEISGYANWIDLDNINPIPLTEEILLKCGFDRTEYNDYRHPVLIGTLTLYEGIAELHLSDMYSVWVNNLHQLQNLFYAITGKELEVKL